MLYYVSGPVAVLEPGLAVIDCGGVGYKLTVTANTLTSLPTPVFTPSGDVAEGNEVRVYTYMAVKEDAVELFGFSSKDELDAFKLLISVSGVGPKVSDCILLFALKKSEVFPIDVWVKRVMEKFTRRIPPQ